MKFEENMRRLEELSDKIRRPDIGIEDALATFEEGIKLARTLEKELDRMEGRVQALVNSPLEERAAGKEDAEPELDLFAQAEAPSEGLRSNG